MKVRISEPLPEGEFWKCCKCTRPASLGVDEEDAFCPPCFDVLLRDDLAEWHGYGARAVDRAYELNRKDL